MQAPIDTFTRLLQTRGFAVGPNGASYKVVTLGPQDQPAIVRTSKTGERETIIDWSGETFNSFYHARNWARMNAQHIECLNENDDPDWADPGMGT